MSDDAPTLLVPSSELWQWAQALTTIATLLGRVRAQRTGAGRLAFDDAEHAALQHEVRQHPAARLMNPSEIVEWSQRVPAVVREQPPGESFGVWAAQMVNETGQSTGEWGLEAHTWAAGVPTSSVRVVCRDAADVLALTQYLRANPTAETLRRVGELAAHGNRITTVSVEAAPLLGEAEWAAIVRTQLSPEVARRVIVTDPGHPHHRAWRELYALVCEEIARVGADPERLAAVIAKGPRWRAGVRNPPALAHWAITEARQSTGYLTMITGDAAAVDPVESSSAPRLAEVRDPHQALAWAAALDAGNAEHALEAKLGFGRWGAPVDAILGRTFPGLMTSAVSAAKPRRPPVTVVVEESVEPARRPLDTAVLAGFVAEVDRLDPAKAIDRRAAHIMLGRVHLEVDRRIATVFADDPQIVTKVEQLYPDGLPDPAAAAHLSLARQHETAAVAAESDAAGADQLVEREGHQQVATAEWGLAERHHGLAGAASQLPSRSFRAR